MCVCVCVFWLLIDWFLKNLLFILATESMAICIFDSFIENNDIVSLAQGAPNSIPIDEVFL